MYLFWAVFIQIISVFTTWLFYFFIPWFLKHVHSSNLKFLVLDSSSQFLFQFLGSQFIVPVLSSLDPRSQFIVPVISSLDSSSNFLFSVRQIPLHSICSQFLRSQFIVPIISSLDSSSKFLFSVPQIPFHSSFSQFLRSHFIVPVLSSLDPSSQLLFSVPQIPFHSSCSHLIVPGLSSQILFSVPVFRLYFPVPVFLILFLDSSLQFLFSWFQFPIFFRIKDISCVFSETRKKRSSRIKAGCRMRMRDQFSCNSNLYMYLS